MAEAHSIPTGPKFQDLTGRTFGHLTVVSFGGRNKFGNSVWNCVCDSCSQKKAVGIGALKIKKPAVGPCDCWKSGVRETVEYRAWKSMKGRCTNPTLKAFPQYGGRGITVHAEWMTSFSAFLSDVGNRPSAEHSLDRYPNNDGNYEPGNVRWATKSEQARNRRSTCILTHDGKSLPLVEWAAITGLARDTITARLKRGWGVSDALTTPVD